ncbi:MAG: pectin esterase [Ardenticatenaceae bacterium]|nr:pectin esterase [Ardenticatenaceae bacterium]
MNAQAHLSTSQLRLRASWIGRIVFLLALFLAILLLFSLQKSAQSASNIVLEVHEYDPNLAFGTGPLITEFTYLVNADNAGDPTDANNLPSTSPQASYSPIVGLGDETTASFSLPEAGEVNGDGEVVDGRYLISVRAEGYKLSGTHVQLPADAGTVIVELVADPLPLSRIRVHAFHDNRPVNGEDDAAGIGTTGFEDGLAGFRIILEDVVGEVTVDWYGNPLCTEYERDGNGDIIFAGDTPIISAANPNNGGVCYTDANGDVTIDNIPRGKYEVIVVPPDGQENDWVQTTTIEGTHVIDAWPIEGDSGDSPREGLNQAAVWVGFVQECTFGDTGDSCGAGNDATGTGTVTGIVKTIVQWTPPVNSPPPSLGEAVYKPWIALTDIGNTDQQVYLGRGNEDGSFTINNVPDGTYQMSIWDDPLDYIIGFYTIQIPEPAANDTDSNPQTVEMGDVGIPRWFGWLSGYVYMDDGLGSDGLPNPGVLTATNGIRDCVDPNDLDTCERAIDGIALGTRFRDGTLQYGTFTDNDGYYEFPEVFELEKFAVMEVDFGRFGRTGIAVHDPYNPNEVTVINSELGGDLLAAELSWAGKRSWVDFGKSVYDASAGENGGISGMVLYATTRNELDVRFAAAEDYEPGIPGVTLNLYDDTGTILLYTLQSDSFVHPSGCDIFDANGNPLPDPLGLAANCIEVPNISSEVRDGAYDGGYAFETYCPDGYYDGCPEETIPPGDYIVEVEPLPFYKVLETTDQNTSEGSEHVPQPLIPAPLIPSPTCDGGTGSDCNRRFVTVHAGQNAAADFYLLPDFEPGEVVPIPGRIYGFALDDLNIETDPNRIYYGEKRGIPNTPVGIRDFTGRLVAMANSDINGIFEVLVPSTYSANCPIPAGVCPAIYKVIVNDPGDPGNPTPNFNPNYQTLTFQFDVWPGKTTYADVATFAITTLNETPGGYNQPAQCGLPDDAPEIHFVNDPRRTPSQLIIVNGKGFGNTPGKVTVGNVAYFGADINSWSDTEIRFNATDNPLGPQQLLVESNNGQVSPSGVTMHLRQGGGSYNPPVEWVDDTYDGSNGTSNGNSGRPWTTIQEAIDAAAPGSLVIVRPGSGAYYEDITINKAVWVQGYGPGALDGLGSGGSVLDMRFSTQAVVINGVAPGAYSSGSHPVLDGFRIANSRDEQDIGGGLYVEANGAYAVISNNIIQSNGGNLGGAIVVGQPYAGDNNNDNIRIHHNRILNNGGISRAGAVGIYNGADNYELDHNDICGNYSGEYGGGISHFGLSTNSSIHHNRIYYNSSFDEGGGLMIAGEQVGCAAIVAGQCVVNPGDPGTPFTTGSGNVAVYNNLFQANLANDDGGAIRLLQPWDYDIDITNNMIVNNVSTDLGGGISLDDASAVTVVNNTVANNATTATAEDSDKLAHAAGIVAEPYSIGFSDFLETEVGPGASAPGFPDPVMFNNIIWHNVAYTFTLGVGLLPPGGVVFDTEVFGGGSLTGDASNHLTADGDPLFVDAYASDLDAVAFNNELTFISVVFVTNYITGTLPGDYHLDFGSPAIDAGITSLSTVSAPNADFDDQVRPQDGGYEIGADEFPGGVTAVPFPATSILDDFNRANNNILGLNWHDTNPPASYRINANTLQIRTGAFAEVTWDILPSGFGPDQEVFFTFTDVSTLADEQGLILKDTGPNLIEVLYDYPNSQVEIWTKDGGAWQQQDTLNGVSFGVGDQFGARTLADGTVNVYKNGTLIGSTNIAGAWPYTAGGGDIGVGFIGTTNSGAGNARIDDFGGGNVP